MIYGGLILKLITCKPSRTQERTEGEVINASHGMESFSHGWLVSAWERLGVRRPGCGASWALVSASMLSNRGPRSFSLLQGALILSFTALDSCTPTVGSREGEWRLGGAQALVGAGLGGEV